MNFIRKSIEFTIKTIIIGNTHSNTSITPPLEEPANAPKANEPKANERLPRFII